MFHQSDSLVSNPAAGADALPLPPKRREFSPAARVVGDALARFLLRPITWLLRPVGIWPRGLIRRFNRARVLDCKPFVPTEHDVVVASYFKSGTNRTMQMALQIAWNGAAEFEHIHDLVPWIEWPQSRKGFAVPLCDALWKQCPSGLRVIKTHLPMEKLRYSEAGRYVWVVRDPKNVFVSSYHFVKSVTLGPLMPSIDEWLDIFLSEDAFQGSWAEHLAGGWGYRDRDNVLFLTFEGMKRAPVNTIDRLAQFMGVEVTAEERDRVVHRASYDYMKTNGHKFDTIGISPPWVSSRRTMIRRGRAGGSDELLNSNQQERIDDYCRAELLRLGCDFPYDDYF